jgi:hypothetical protein
MEYRSASNNDEIFSLKDEDFEKVFYGCINRLNKILKSSYYFGNDGRKGPIGKMIQDILNYHLRIINRSSEDPLRIKDLRYLRDSHLQLLARFGMELEYLRNNNYDVYKLFIKVLRKDKQNYYGYRFELKIAIMLMSQKIDFEKAESPDFNINFNNSRIFIECGTTTLDKSKNVDVRYKINSVIEKKSKMDYANNDTVLFIDYSNIMYNSLLSGNRIKPEYLIDSFNEVIQKSNFGAVVLFANVLNWETKIFNLTACPIKGIQISNELNSFMNYLFPNDDTEISYTVLSLI